ncbi:MAG: extracellular solute-binding protein [Thermanaerothrix sp.]|uniref:Extracellular solute-binding protein n=1 Tax=Thermanaerothrix solaris TaxID=3058434 RepID=A0ABU3NQ88_9CHLR|nr:extracellular solute-binding protein [Thermanaerothrix sp. 4228-RoL]MDT8899003.1 extracellular solute-binding protein [Thermanaerothrix sp. 4228-RoL]
MRSSSRFLMLMVLVALVLALAGCGGQAATGPKVVKVLAMQQAGPTPEEMNAIVNEFNQKNPNIKVEIEYVSYDALHDKIVTAMATTPPSYDVILVDDIWYAEFAKAGYLWDVTDKIDAQTKEKVFATAWDITTVNGRIYGMPWLLDAKYFYYNEKILKEAGFDHPPATWEELVEQARVIKEKGLVEYPIAWSWAQAEAAICDFVALLYGNGGRFVDDQGKPAFNDEKGVQVLEWMVKTIDEGISNPASVSYVEEDVRNVFSQGKAAFALNWLYMYDLAALNEQESQVVGQVKMSLVPVFQSMAQQGLKSATINGSMGFSVVDKSPNREAAWEYVKYLTSEDVQKRYAAHLLPIWSANYEGEALEALKALNPATPVTVPMFKEQFPYAHVRPKVPYYLEGSKALQLALQEALTKQKTAAQALNDAAAKWVELQSK